MWLYHGTYDMFYRDILKTKKLTPGKNRDTITIKLDQLINTRHGGKLRGGCLYLSSDKEAMWGFDRYFRVSTSKLNTTKLFVADNSQLDHILGSRDTTETMAHVDQYIKSYVPFRVYLDNKEEYTKLYVPEFLYFGEIEVGRGVA